MQSANNARYAIPDPTLPDNQMKTYQALSWVADAVGHTSRFAATVDYAVFELAGERKLNIPNHPFELLLKRPNPIASRFQLFEATFANLLLAGNAYWFLNRTSENVPPSEIYALPPNRIKKIPGGQVGTVSHYEWDAGNGQKVPLEWWEVAHFAEYHPRNMWTGLSRVESVGREIEKDIKAAEYDVNFYGKDNAKPEGILSVKGSMPEAQFKALEQRFVRKHSGTKRSMAIVQGPETLDYIQLALNYADMDFLANRGFTRDQIYNHFAPGLSSVLSVNSTEANARTGKATLMEFAIWPLLVSVQETMGNAILDAYGENITGQFEDVRLSDKAMELNEQTEYAKSHTIDEVRQKYHNDDPIGDERGTMLIAQITPTTGIEAPEPTPPANTLGQALGDDETGAGADDETAGQMKGQRLPGLWDNVADELNLWKRHTSKRIKAGRNLREFDTKFIPPTLKAAIEGALEMAGTPSDAAAIFANALAWEGYP